MKKPFDIKIAAAAFLFLLLAVFHYKETCYSYDDFCIELPYGFYIVLHFVVCSYFLCKAYYYKPMRRDHLSFKFIISLLFVFLYNPLVRVKMDLGLWLCTNIITMIFIIFFEIPTFIYLRHRRARYNEIIVKRYQRVQFKVKEKLVKETHKNNPPIMGMLIDLEQNYKDMYKQTIEELFANIATDILKKIKK
ncbi:MAG: hypothetical protein IJ545_04825 [Alphaproteobacteria bacterium]|nr:hypothetical protein [Alphaproteobacteria bacterium]